MSAAGEAQAIASLGAMLDGFRLSQCLATVARLGIADAIDDGPDGTAHAVIAARVEADPDALRRVLDALAAHGVFEAVADEGSTATVVWRHCERSRLLRSDHPAALGHRARVLGELAWPAWGALDHCVRSGRPAFDEVFGMPLFAHLGAHPRSGEAFGRAMTSFTRMTAGAFAEAVDLDGISHIVDVGGGDGVFVSRLLQSRAQLQATIVDRPEVVSRGAPAVGAPLRSRLTLTAADFHEEPLPRADACLLSWVLHDWDDDTCVAVLRRCAQAVGPRGRVFVVEMLLAAGEDGRPALMFDLEMLVQTGGRERTRAQYEALCAAAGLRVQACVAMAAPQSVLVASPAPESASEALEGGAGSGPSAT